MPFAIGQQVVRSGAAMHALMVMTPKSPMTVGRKRLDDLRVPTGINPVECWLIEQARQLASGVALMVHTDRGPARVATPSATGRQGCCFS
ncbi:MAG TPA: hypothetical protein VKU41_01875 [Polyangiaceae bacterium]|nr:hypothetical protein [Polyangiaceae bacterium]